MFSRVYGAAVYGIEGSLVTAEADISDGLPNFLLVGYLSSEVKEAKERVRLSIKNAGYRLPIKKITVNLSPADKRKEGTGFDLPVAVAVLTAFGYLPQEGMEDVVFAGELSLNGQVKGIRGILPIILAAKRAGKKRCIIPAANTMEGELVEGISIIGVHSLRETVDYLTGKRSPSSDKRRKDAVTRKQKKQLDFADVIGQETVKRAVEIAVAGMHNILIIGPPGAGKSMIASRIPDIMPHPTMEERMEIARVYSVAGLLKEEEGLFVGRPFRSPHHTVTPVALAGGGRLPLPGEISLATEGILFLDELAEFDRGSLEVLRQPMEEKQVAIVRQQGSYVYPANFMLVAAMNPCPCGYYPDRNRCRCSHSMVQKYLGKISRPLLERIDLCVEASPIKYEELTEKRKGETSAAIRKRVITARKRQKNRYAKEALSCNAMLDAEKTKTYCRLDEEGQEYLKKVYQKYELSARAYHRILKVARTIADLEGSDEILQCHLQEAVCYRGLDLQYWNGGSL